MCRHRCASPPISFAKGYDQNAHQQMPDENRARVVEGGHINAIIDLLQHDSLLPYVVTVLYNVLVDYGKELSPIII